MLIFTYCSCRSSRYGYQYCCFTSDSRKQERSLYKPPELNTIDSEFIKWCENYSGWQLALLQSANKGKNLLMVGQLEKSRELEKKIQKKYGNTILDENSLDSDYYITIGWSGNAEEIKRLAVFLLKEYKEDCYRGLFNRLEQTIRKTDDSTGYEINTKAFNAIFIPESTKNASKNPNNIKTSIWCKMARKVASSPDIYLSCASAQNKQEKLNMRKKNIEKCIEALSNLDNLSGKVHLLIAYDYFSIAAKIDIRIDYEYLWFY